MVELQDSPKTFPFFSLPLELRNSIYGHLTGCSRPVPFSVKRLPAHDNLTCSASQILVPYLLRISKQFKAEYEKEVIRSVHLTFKAKSPVLRAGKLLLFIPAIYSDHITSIEWTITDCYPNNVHSITF